MTGDFPLNATAPRVVLSNGRSVADPFFNIAYPLARKNDVNMLKADDAHLVNLRVQKSVHAAARPQGRVERRRVQPVQHAAATDFLSTDIRSSLFASADQLRAGACRAARGSDDVLIADEVHDTAGFEHEIKRSGVFFKRRIPLISWSPVCPPGARRGPPTNSAGRYDRSPLGLGRTEMPRRSSKPDVKSRLFRTLEVAVLSLVFAAPSTAQNSPAAKSPRERPELHAFRVAHPPVIDGALDDEAWTQPAMETTEWLSYNPLNGDRIPQQTHVWIAYDDNYFYFAFKCDDPEPARIKTSIARRDSVWNDDWVGLSLDALGTGQLSYHMMVNPSGVQMDMLNSVAAGEDQAPDWIWDSAGRLHRNRLHRGDPPAASKHPLHVGGRTSIWGFSSGAGSAASASRSPGRRLMPGTWVFEKHATLDRAGAASSSGARPDTDRHVRHQPGAGHAEPMGRHRIRRAVSD